MTAPKPDARMKVWNPEWNTSTVTALVKGIIHDKAWDRGPILADALEEAGCDDAYALNQLRTRKKWTPKAHILRFCLGKDYKTAFQYRHWLALVDQVGYPGGVWRLKAGSSRQPTGLQLYILRCKWWGWSLRPLNDAAPHGRDVILAYARKHGFATRLSHPIGFPQSEEGDLAIYLPPLMPDSYVPFLDENAPEPA